MTEETDKRLVSMANQIALNFAAIGHDKAVLATADHIDMFWDPRMKSRIFELLAAGDDGFSEAGRAAIQKLAAGADPAPQTRATQFNDAGEIGHSDAG